MELGAPPFKERGELVPEQGAVLPRRKALAPKHLVEHGSELNSHLGQILRRRTLSDADVGGAVDQAVVEDGVILLGLADVPEVGAGENVVIVDLARVDEVPRERGSG